MSRAALRASLALWRRRLAYRQRRLKVSVRHHRNNSARKWRGLVDEAHHKIARRERQLAETRPLRERAHAEMVKLLGIMEQGANNAGADVARIIRGGGGDPAARPPWCGYAMAYVYKKAGSRAVDWRWAAVRLVSAVSGVRRTTAPMKGDLVRFTFDHIGMFEKDNGDGTITTLEGNTGATGAVSDSKTGGDGVYRKVRSKQLVNDYLRVTR